jgi:hypothetical protein
MTNRVSIQARVWPSNDRTYHFAEQAQGGLPATPNTGVCFSGGGTRSMSATMGQLRGLTELGLVDRIRYISCVSGGAWASRAYTYYNTGAANDREFLGPVTAPQHITMDGLKGIDETCLGYTATRSLRNLIFNHLVDGTPEDRVWIDAIGQIYFQPFGLYDAKKPSYFSLNDTTVTDIKHRNPALTEATFHTVRTASPRPYLIINGTMIGPTHLSPFQTEPVVNMQYTPLYVGTPYGMEVTYRAAERSTKQTYWTGGGFVEPFAYGGPAPAEVPQNDLVSLSIPSRPWTLADASGISGSAFAGFVEEEHIWGLLDDTDKLAPEALYWPFTTTSTSETTDFAFGDGGVMENYGLLSLLQRKVETIIIFINTVSSLDSTAHPDELAKGNGIDAYLPPLFGHPVQSSGTFTGHNQVFAASDFATVTRKLQAAK